MMGVCAVFMGSMQSDDDDDGDSDGSDEFDSFIVEDGEGEEEDEVENSDEGEKGPGQRQMQGARSAGRDGSRRVRTIHVFRLLQSWPGHLAACVRHLLPLLFAIASCRPWGAEYSSPSPSPRGCFAIDGELCTGVCTLGSGRHCVGI